MELNATVASDIYSRFERGESISDSKELTFLVNETFWSSSTTNQHNNKKRIDNYSNAYSHSLKGNPVIGKLNNVHLDKLFQDKSKCATCTHILWLSA